MGYTVLVEEVCKTRMLYDKSAELKKVIEKALNGIDETNIHELQ